MSFRLLAALAAGAVLYGQQAAAPTGYTISGVVVSHATNRPLGGVGVMLNSTQQAGEEARPPRVSLSVITSADGKFSFTDLPPGKYALLAQQRNQPEVETYQGHEGFFTGLVVGPGVDTEHIVFPLQSPARLSGTVLDDSGEPVQASVMLFRKAIVNGKMEVAQAGQTNTNASGAFHFAHLPAGIYFVAVSGRPWYVESIAPGQAVPPEFDVAYAVTYYGNTPDPNAAAPIQLAEGGSATIQISLHAVPAVHVPVLDGTETEAVQGRGFSGSIYAEGPGGTRIPISAFIGSELGGVAPGHYFVDVNVQDTLDGGKTTDRRFRGDMDLTPGTTLTPTPSPPISISGHVSNEAGPTPEGAMLMLTGKQTYYAQVGKDGSFSFDQNPVEPGSYQLVLSNAPHLYIKSERTVSVPDGAKLDLAVVVAQTAARIRGFAVQNDKPVSAAMVLLLPADFKHAALARRDQSDSDGSFLLPDIVPGRYYLLAIDDGRDLAYSDPAVMKPYLSGAVRVDVTSSTDASVKVNVLGRNR